MTLLETRIPVQKLASGTRAIVVGLSGASSEVARLAELGLGKGARIEVVLNGRPCIVQVGASRICIRPSRDLRVWVLPE